MKKVILYAITILVATLGATTRENYCNTPSTPNDNPEGSCQQNGYICNLGFNIVGEDNIMFFQLGTDTTCTDLLTSSFAPKRNPEDPDTTAWFFLVENQEKMGPLSITLASSLAMLAVNNGIPVDIIYKSVDNTAFGGINVAFGIIKLLSIRLVQTPIIQ